MSHDTEFYTEQTIASWDEAADIHSNINFDLLEQVSHASYNHLNPVFNTLIDDYGVKNKSIAQVCCNNGIDLISIKNKGAERCVGIDGSAEFIKQANILSQAANHQDIEYLCSDIYSVPNEYHLKFDLVFITVGVLYWMPDINRFLSVCSQLLKTGGHLLIEEIHPIVNMYEEGAPSYIQNSYFENTPCKDESGLDYFTNQTYKGKPNYWFSHKLSDILNGALATNLSLKRFDELSYNTGNYCADLETIDSNPPLTMHLVFEKGMS